ncbi:MAG: RsmB/NOP family class I SAM-dependent RNA methyltransferase [Sphingomonadales bacterium]|jgi:16S rRNA (cytosine967-C5)-methyltransferase|nr:RsmB/NOP family class I SAM-dependent RNA methyltransferase [Sphingomonadales bacterium]MBK9004844.1 RsmB/NOP family class I SAM-dependent RNA methyltransferase [Sphingomonadales bacterium]MBK9267427.1 RsmB/NOP family class I SAM-dependent RNA methyltransferase [Sphingomonadales bacterium]MBP6433189.1 RsmB/NOP family class I SAM-dependent RNA methyltransferase [Sphingorhabdus sp.]
MNTRPTTATGLAARRTALRMLDACLRTGQPLDQAASAMAKGLEPSDRALAIAIAQEVLRWLPDLDLLIDSQTRLPLAEDAKARMVLRMALAQMLRLGTPPHAAIATALPLLDKGPRRLVHGVLGSLWRLQPKLADAPSLTHPVADRWKAAWGADRVEAARVALAEPPPLDLTLADPAQTARWAQELEGTSLAPGHIRLPRGSAIEMLPGYAEGAWWVQDLAASLPARLLGQGNHRDALDLCAAPGGKAMQLASQGWHVTALDKSAKRMERFAANLERTGLQVKSDIGDVLTWQPEAQFDAVLLDAPCSATGTFRRHPDVLHRIGPKQVAELVELQAAMLDRAATMVKPGGRLVYATCSLEPEEGEAQADAFLARHGNYAKADIDTALLPEGIAPKDGTIRTLPGMLADRGGLDGFFIACFTRAQ